MRSLYYSRNLEALLRSNPALAKKTRKLSSSGARSLEAQNGQPIIAEQDSKGTWHTLQSSYDPSHEAEERARAIKLDPNRICLVLGLGAGYLLEALLEQESAATTRFLVVEPNTAVFKAALGCRDLSRILGSSNINFHIGGHVKRLAALWDSLPVDRRILPPCVVQHFKSARLHARFLQSALEMIKGRVLKSSLEFDNLANSSRRFFDNLLQNLPCFLQDPGVKVLEGLFRDRPAILVSAGPSLDKNIRLLSEMSGRAVLIAMDAAVKPLLAKGIEPHFIMSVDPGSANHEHLRGANTSRSHLIFEASVYPETMHQFAGRRFVAFLEDSFYEFLHDEIEEKGLLSGWGSVSTLALDFARLLGCDPIIFAGQDLSFTGKRTYCNNTTYQEGWLANVNSEAELRDHSQWEVQRQNPVSTLDIFGHETFTTTRLLSYALWIGEKIQSSGDIRCINSTEGGILSEGIDLLSLKDALFRHCRNEIPVWDRIPQRKLPPVSTNKLERFLTVTLKHLAKMRVTCERSLEKLDHYARLDSINPGAATGPTPEQWWKRFQKSAFCYPKTARLLEFFNQPAIREFLHSSSSGSHSGLQHEWERYRRFASSILVVTDYLESKLGELLSTLNSGERSVHPSQEIAH